jgi:NAD(P)H-dependent FMN reductase
MRIEIISGSPRENSVTNRLVLFLEKFLNSHSDHEIGLIDLRDHVLPHIQNVFRSADDAPAEYRHLAERMFAADAYIIVTPEYNGSYSPAMQNLFDHFPKRQRKVFGLATGSPGALGGMRAAMQLQQFVMALFGIASPHMLITPMIDKKFDEEGNLLDPAFQKSIDNFISEFLWLSESLNRSDARTEGNARTTSSRNLAS